MRKISKNCTIQFIQLGNLSAVENLLENGVNVNAMDDKNWTALHHAAKGGKFKHNDL